MMKFVCFFVVILGDRGGLPRSLSLSPSLEYKRYDRDMVGGKNWTKGLPLSRFNVVITYPRDEPRCSRDGDVSAAARRAVREIHPAGGRNGKFTPI